MHRGVTFATSLAVAIVGLGALGAQTPPETPAAAPYSASLVVRFAGDRSSFHIGEEIPSTWSSAAAGPPVTPSPS